MFQHITKRDGGVGNGVIFSGLDECVRLEEAVTTDVRHSASIIMRIAIISRSFVTQP